MSGVSDGSADQDRAEDRVDDEAGGDVSGDSILAGLAEPGANLLEPADVKSAFQVKFVSE